MDMTSSFEDLATFAGQRKRRGNSGWQVCEQMCEREFLYDDQQAVYIV